MWLPGSRTFLVVRQITPSNPAHSDRGAWADWLGAKFVRFDDNMREVAVTEGDKVSAQAKFGYSVDAYGIGDLVEFVDGVSEEAIH
jgi:L-arabinose isomerase